MSHWVDAFLAALTERGAESLVLASGEPPMLRFADSSNVASRQSVALEHLLSLMRRSVGSETWEHFESFGEAHWDEARLGRTYRFHALGGPGHLRIEVSGEQPEPSPEEQPAPGAPQAPAPQPASTLQQVLAPQAASIDLAAIPVARPRAQEVLDGMLRATFELGASDLHLTSTMPPLVRVDGRMRQLDGHAPQTTADLTTLFASITPKRNGEEMETLWDTDFGYELAGVSRFRVNLFHDRLGIGGVFRVIPSRIPRPEDLDLPQRLVDMTQLSKGIVLVTGPTGSGKSTTLAALLHHINETRHEHVITIEDPIEFVHESRTCLINQREVGTHTQSFKRALREALREDPDIVLVGEMRDLETVHIALETAETGHLVFGTLHTTSGPATVDRLIDQFPAAQQQQIRVMLADTLRCVVAQVLCRRRGGGRVAAMELMVGTPAIANLIREGKTHQMMSIMQTSRGEGMQTMTECLVRLVREGTIEPDEALARATDRDDVRRTLERSGFLPKD